MPNVFIESAPGLLLWQNEVGPLKLIWSYLTREFTFGRITVSVSSLLMGVLVLTVTIVASRLITRLIERRMARRRHIDPGLRYTIVRLIRYFVLTIGVLLTLKQAFAVDLTSIAVIFTAL